MARKNGRATGDFLKPDWNEKGSEVIASLQHNYFPSAIVIPNASSWFIVGEGFVPAPAETQEIPLEPIAWSWASKC